MHRCIAACCDQSGHIQNRTNGPAAALHDTSAAGGAAVAIEWSDTNKSRDLAPIQRAEFRQFREQPTAELAQSAYPKGFSAQILVSVFASWPQARAKSRIWRGLTTESGRPALAIAAATEISKPPVASSTISLGMRERRCFTRVAKPSGSRATEKADPAARTCTSKRFLEVVSLVVV